MEFSALLILTIILFFLTKILINRLQVWSYFWKIPGLSVPLYGLPPISLPLVGNAIQCVQQPDLFLKYFTTQVLEYQKQGVNLFRLWMLGTPYAVICRAEAMEAFMSGMKNIQKGRDYNYILPWLGRGLLTSYGSKWKARRRILSPVFHSKPIMKDYLVVMNKRCSQLTQILGRFADSGKEFDLFRVITLCSLDIICEAALGEPVEVQTASDSDYIRAIYSASNTITQRQENPFMKPDFLFKLLGKEKQLNDDLLVLHKNSEDVIFKQEDKFLKGEDMKLNLISCLLNAKDKSPHVVKSLLDIREEVDTFMFEGHDTTSSAIFFACYLLTKHHEILEEVRREINDAFPHEADIELHEEGFKKCPLLEAVIKETLRLYPSVPLFQRTAEEDIVIDRCTIPKGTTCVIIPFALHRDESQFVEAESFMPKRFLPENAALRNHHPYSYVPFSAGARNCVGQKFAMLELKVMLTYIFRNFN